MKQKPLYNDLTRDWKIHFRKDPDTGRKIGFWELFFLRIRKLFIK